MRYAVLSHNSDSQMICLATDGQGSAEEINEKPVWTRSQAPQMIFVQNHLFLIVNAVSLGLHENTKENCGTV